MNKIPFSSGRNGNAVGNINLGRRFIPWERLNISAGLLNVKDFSIPECSEDHDILKRFGGICGKCTRNWF